MRDQKSDAVKRRPGATVRARSLRRNQTEQERLLWNHLRDRRLEGFKFYRQVPIGPYIVDFLCREKKLVIEVDGSQHADSKSDIVRSNWLTAEGYSVLRFWNHELQGSPLAVLDMILAALHGAIADRGDANRFYPTASGQFTQGTAS